MGQFTNYLEEAWLKHILEGTAFTVPTTIALALHTADPGETGASECANSNNYARKTCKAAFDDAAISSAGVYRKIVQKSDIVMNQASGSWGTVTHWSLWDSITYADGNCLAYGSFSAGKPIANLQTPKILASEIVISIPVGNGMTDFLAKEMLDHTFYYNGGVGASYSQPTIYMALSVTTAFGDSGVWTNEISTSGTAYARIATAWTITGTAAANNGALTFAVATASWGSPNSWALADGDTEGAGNMLLYHAKDFGAIAADDQINIPTGDLDITLD